MSWQEDELLVAVLSLAVAAAAVVAWVLVTAVVRHAARRSTAVQDAMRLGRRPARALVAVVAVWQTLLHFGATDGWLHLLVLLVIACVTWLGVNMTGAVELLVARRFDIAGTDNLRIRGVRTQAEVVTRVLEVAIIVLGIASALLTFPSMRAAGASLLASAGLVGVVAGIAGRSTLGNFFAGLQVAFAAPIRLDDVVVVRGEWGRIEEITLTYVVVKVWDQRRLVLPTSYFVEEPFENWTRQRAELLGAVFIHADYTVPVGEVRAELCRYVESHPGWDGRTCTLQVTDATPSTVVLRAVVSAADASTTWDLRCDVREHLLSWLADTYPHALPRLRTAADRAEPAAMSEA